MQNNLTNPFNITFGRLPDEQIKRNDIYDEIITSYNGNNTNPLYILVGARGCGKTVTMTNIANHFKEEKKWIVVDINPHQDILEQLASSIYQKGKLKHLFIHPEFSFSFHGFSFSISGDKSINTVPMLLEVMFEYLKKKNISVLITLDEVNNNKYMKIFAHSFQSFLRNDYNVYLLMTGLHDNVSSLENEKSLTFLYRAPKIYLPPLSIRAITYSYEDLLKMDEKDAFDCAKLTNGYAFAYQLLGYILFESNKKKLDNQVLREFDLSLEEKSYSKIYSELSKKEKEIIHLVANDITSNQDLIKKLNIQNNYLATYKQILYKKGILDISKRGEVSFILPRFKELVLFQEQ